jgi:hypothetical protein
MRMVGRVDNIATIAYMGIIITIDVTTITTTMNMIVTMIII